MKKYISKEDKNYIYTSKYNTYYSLHNRYHGLYQKKYLMLGFFKGYYNMGMEYSHWLECRIEFKYYL